MPKMLTDAQVEQFHSLGYAHPFRAISGDDSLKIRREIEAFESRMGDEAQQFLKIKAHLPFKSLTDLVYNPHILDAVEHVLGPNLLCWGSSFFQKAAHAPRYVSWHQDSYYYGMEPANTCTAWVAISTSNIASGCVKVIPRSHLAQAEFDTAPDPNNLLPRGQTTANVDTSKAVNLELRPGEFSLHHEAVVHNSEPNNSDDRRIGLSIHYIPTSTRQVRFRPEGRRPAAMLVRGVDAFDHWDKETPTELQFDPAMYEYLEVLRQQYYARTV
jgi:non-haem Fe2+, alpha-ketoglutarate-dependent halogenase